MIVTYQLRGTRTTQAPSTKLAQDQTLIDWVPFAMVWVTSCRVLLPVQGREPTWRLDVFPQETETEFFQNVSSSSTASLVDEPRAGHLTEMWTELHPSPGLALAKNAAECCRPRWADSMMLRLLLDPLPDVDEWRATVQLTYVEFLTITA